MEITACSSNASDYNYNFCQIQILHLTSRNPDEMALLY